MRIANIYNGYFQVKRAVEILVILIKHGLHEWPLIGRRKRTGKAQKQVYSTPERIRITIEELGPTYIKFGQILADRPDVISDRFRQELKQLQSKAKPIPDDIALSLVEKELGCKIEDIFAEFDRTCLAAASIGQVYQARLKTGEEVIIKIQRPNIEQKIKLDLYLMRYLAKRTAKDYPELAYMNLLGLVDEFGAGIIKELDYYNEASNILRFRELFKNEQGIYFPKVHTELSTRRLLVMEKIKGLSPDDPVALRQAGLDPDKVAENGANAILKMIMEHGYFHADPHPGNIFIQEGNIVAFIDCGMTGVLKPGEMAFLADFCLGFVKKDSIALTKSLITLCGVKFFDRFDELEFELSDLIKRNSYVPFDKIDFAQIMQECIQLIVKYKLQIPSGIFMLIKSLATIQKFAVQLSPDTALGPIIIPYAKKLVMSKFAPRRLAGQLFDTLRSYVDLAQSLPNDVSEILYKLKEGKIKHEILLHEENQLVRRMLKRLSAIFLTGAIFIGSAILVIWRSDLWFGLALLYTSGTLAAWYILRIVFGNDRQ